MHIKVIKAQNYQRVSLGRNLEILSCDCYFEYLIQDHYLAKNCTANMEKHYILVTANIEDINININTNKYEC